MTEAVKYKAKRSDSNNTPTVRGVYVHHVFEMRTKRPNGKPCTPRRDLTLAFPKLALDPQQCGNYQYLSRHLMEAVSREPQWGGQWPVGGHLPIKDGDVPYVPQPKPGEPLLTAAQIEEMYGWRKGNWIIEVTNYLEPGPKIAVMRNGRIDELPAQTVNGIEAFKSGDYCIVNLCAYTFWNEKAGCNYGFDGVLWVGEGERVGKKSAGSKSTVQMFGGMGPVSGVPVAAPVSAVPTPQQYVPPTAPGPQGAVHHAPPLAAPAPTAYAPAPQQYAAPPPLAAPPAPTYAAPPAPTYTPPVPGASGLPAFPAPR